MKTPEEKKKNRIYMRAYLASKRNDPAWLEKERARCREKNRKRRLCAEQRAKERKSRKAYYAKNRERLIQENKNWYAKHPEYNRKKMIEARRKYPEKFLWVNARDRAKEKGVAFNLEISDIVIPDICPVLGISINRFAGRGFDPRSPSVDRIIPNIGYVRGNVRVISYRANELKKDATPEELLAVAQYAFEESARVCAELSG